MGRSLVRTSSMVYAGCTCDFNKTQTQKVVQREIWEHRCLLKVPTLQFTPFWMV